MSLTTARQRRLLSVAMASTADAETLCDDLDAQTPSLADDQTWTGANTFSGTSTFVTVVTTTGTFTTLNGTTVNVGASGTAGTLNVFPTTASKGKLAVTVSDQTGNTTVSLNVAAMAAARTLTVPDPGAAASFVMTAGNQTIAGNKTLTGTTEADILNVGASGTVGALNVYPTTASKGKLAVSVTDQTGDTTVSLTVAAMAAARTINLPDPLATADILLGMQAAVARTATSDGLTTGTIADGGSRQFIAVTSSSANNIITLPTPTVGTMIILGVGSNGFKLQTSAPSTIAINGGTGASAKSAIAASTMVIAICTSATTWQCISLAATTLAATAAAA